ncbi:ATP synthase lipid-binding protein, mitochondrial-like isoform X1 [Tachypleus tridentatus]|uniref:ATP synthase lipid-binding protein, mitochondrial-like isoform X1 n=1 Tax=Tachypleus tridentatus TaxID=6853 RepID=UPI003FD5DFEF
MYACARYTCPVARSLILARPVVSTAFNGSISCENSNLHSANQKSVGINLAVPSPFMNQVTRFLQTSATQRDIDSAAKFIGAGAATVGVAGSGEVKGCASCWGSWCSGEVKGCALCWSSWIRSWYWKCIWQFNHWLCPESITETAALLICHSRVCSL